MLVGRGEVATLAQDRRDGSETLVDFNAAASHLDRRSWIGGLLCWLEVGERAVCPIISSASWAKRRTGGLAAARMAIVWHANSNISYVYTSERVRKTRAGIMNLPWNNANFRPDDAELYNTLSLNFQRGELDRQIFPKTIASYQHGT